MNNANKHEHYELLNLLGYGLAKFNHEFIKQFNCKSKEQFYQYFVDLGIVQTKSVVKNRQDLFDPYFDNGRQGWWQKKEVYEHRKILIDSLFGHENVVNYANIVKLILKNNYAVSDLLIADKIEPITQSKFKKMQETGLEAELYFINNYRTIEIFGNGILEDARLFGDGYDFQISTNTNNYLAEIKGVRQNKGKIRLTENEYIKACEYKHDYILTLVMNLDDIPLFLTIDNPVNNLAFKEVILQSKPIKEYHLEREIC
ncbi:DUF3883 domain-containing protein [Moraxella nasovis]|uniref:DUF3883 domain-containing protein n=1 Tax=Moraxella nasovis TaxID=2904121 RepID=UPI001F600D4A|nr:DUF3883 domain-containing protein [Moraxella nasovis]UNU73475.1 DUF3883 domain-containing protein [Moraxella nasovis]